MGDLSAHFDSSEFGGRPHPGLVGLLELLRRSKGGRPLRIVSGIRTPARNAAVGGARRSQHLVGRAADIPSGYCTPAEAARVGFTGIGISTDGRWAIHVDVRSTPKAAWRYLADGSTTPARFP